MRAVLKAVELAEETHGRIHVICDNQAVVDIVYGIFGMNFTYPECDNYLWERLRKAGQAAVCWLALHPVDPKPHYRSGGGANWNIQARQKDE